MWPGGRQRLGRRLGAVQNRRKGQEIQSVQRLLSLAKGCREETKADGGTIRRNICVTCWKSGGEGAGKTKAGELFLRVGGKTTEGCKRMSRSRPEDFDAPSSSVEQAGGEEWGVHVKAKPVS